MSSSKKSARLVVGLFVASVAYGVVLLLVFQPEVQGLEADQLFARADDARDFLVADLGFPIIYGICSGFAYWRFGRLLTGGRPPHVFVAAAIAITTAAVLDLAENVLLLSAIDAKSKPTVDAAHAIAVPKVIFFVIGAALALVVLMRAVATLRQT